jgi:hypothetical protein
MAVFHGLSGSAPAQADGGYNVSKLPGANCLTERLASRMNPAFPAS